MASPYKMKLLTHLMKSPNPNTKKSVLREAAKKRKRWNIVRGDKVQVVGNHPEKGKQGIVKEVRRAQERCIVEGINVGRYHRKGDPDRGIVGTTYERERSVHYSNLNLVDPVTNQPTRIFRKYLDDGTKVRVSKKSGAIIPRPAILTVRKRPVNPIVTESDTLDEDVWAQTYVADQPV